MKNYNRINLVLTILFAVVGVVQCVRWYNPSASIIIYFLNFIPAIAFLIIYLVNRKISNKAARSRVTNVCIMMLLFWGLATIVVEVIIDATTEVTNVRSYDDILPQWGKDLVGHFPRPIPADAKDIKFSFLPKFLQGGAHVQLRYSTTPETINKLYEQFSKLRTQFYFGGGKYENQKREDWMPSTSFYTGGKDFYDDESGAQKFTKDYEIMIFDRVLKEKERKGFNHGESHGVAISKKRSEVVYWAESW